MPGGISSSNGPRRPVQLAICNNNGTGAASHANAMPPLVVLHTGTDALPRALEDVRIILETGRLPRRTPGGAGRPAAPQGDDLVVIGAGGQASQGDPAVVLPNGAIAGPQAPDDPSPTVAMTGWNPDVRPYEESCQDHEDYISSIPLLKALAFFHKDEPDGRLFDRIVKAARKLSASGTAPEGVEWRMPPSDIRTPPDWFKKPKATEPEIVLPLEILKTGRKYPESVDRLVKWWSHMFGRKTDPS